MKISIITATYNCAPVVGDCLASVQSQSYTDIEHIVIDGASTDGTLEILQNHHEQFKVLISEPDEGIYPALNKGLCLATGDLVGFLHADDLFAHQDVVDHIARVFSANPSVSAVYGDLQYVRQNNPSNIIRNWQSQHFSPKRLARGWMPPHPTLYLRREWYAKIGGFDPSYKVAADYLSILQLFKDQEFKATYLPEVLVKMRIGGASNRSLRAMRQKSTEDWKALRQNNFSRYAAARALLWKNISKVSQFF